MGWQFHNDEPIYLQIVNEVKRRIISGEYPSGSQLPTVRQLAEEISVNPNTVQKAMTELERENLVYSQGTIGRFISEDPELPQKLRYYLANEKIRAFLHTMDALGISDDEIISLVKNMKRGNMNDGFEG